MYAPLHPDDGDTAYIPNDKLTGVSDRGRLGEMRDFLVRDSRGVREFICERAESRAQNKRDLWSKPRLRQNKFCGTRGLLKFAGAGFRLRSHVYLIRTRKKSRQSTPRSDSPSCPPASP